MNSTELFEDHMQRLLALLDMIRAAKAGVSGINENIPEWLRKDFTDLMTGVEMPLDTAFDRVSILIDCSRKAYKESV